jgi:hypothetical protein
MWKALRREGWRTLSKLPSTSTQELSTTWYGHRHANKHVLGFVVPSLVAVGLTRMHDDRG